MKNIVATTDFSARAALAVLRASQLASHFSAALSLVHVVDDDMPLDFATAAVHAAESELAKVADEVREKYQVSSRIEVTRGQAFKGILDAAEEASADLIVVGAHRRDILREIFVGTTAERTIRSSKLPVLMVNADKRTPYQRILIATEFSDCSIHASKVVRQLGLLDGTLVSLMHGYDDPRRTLMIGSTFSDDQIEKRVQEERTVLKGQLKRFAADVGIRPVSQHLCDIERSIAATIHEAAQRDNVDLIAIGTHGRSGILKVLLGSVAEQVLSLSNRDVLVVPMHALAS